jgi:hypothetical protein
MKNTQLMEYTVPQGVKATKTELIIPPGLAKEEWASLWNYLATAEEAVNLWQADALTYGQKNYEPEYVSSVTGQQELGMHGMERLVLIQQVDPAWRSAVLTQAHYIVAAKRCADSKEREVWLDTAVIENLTPRELQASIRAKEVIHIEMEKRKVSLPSPYAARAEYRAWRKELGEAWQSWYREDWFDVRETMKEMHDCYVWMGEMGPKAPPRGKESP